jgi:hypothetical protein
VGLLPQALDGFFQPIQRGVEVLADFQLRQPFDVADGQRLSLQRRIAFAQFQVQFRQSPLGESSRQVRHAVRAASKNGGKRIPCL